MIPVRAVLLVSTFAVLLGLINIGSSTAFEAMISLALIGHYTSYLLPIVLVVFRRLGKRHVPWGPFRLGRYGTPINLVAIVYSALLVVFMVFPSYQPVTPKNMNYASLVFGMVMILSYAMWLLYGRKTFTGPVKEVVESVQGK